MVKLSLYISICLALFSSCSREDEIDLHVPFKKRLVAEVFIGEGDSVFNAILTHTKPVFGEPNNSMPDYVKDANAYIGKGSEQINLSFNGNFSQYYSDALPYKIKSGENYYFEASDGNEKVYGSTTIPEKPNLSYSVKLDSSINDAYFYNATITCTNQSEKSGYIRVMARIIFSDSSYGTMFENSFNEIKLLGKNQSIQRKLYSYKPSEFVYPVRIEISGINCDEAYAKYYNNTTPFNFYNILPINEPTIAYSNMSNKIGIIASYSSAPTQVFKFQ